MTKGNDNDHAMNDTVELGLAGRMAQAFIHSPLTPLLFIAMLGMGVLGLIMTPRQEDPQISVPMVDIFVSYPGATAEEVSSLAINPLERIMSEIPGVKHVYSAVQRGQGIVTVRFIVGEERDPSLVKVHEKIQSNMDKMPPGVRLPLIKAVGINDVPVVTLTLWSENLDQGQLRALSNNVLQRLKEIPDTGSGFIVGGLREQVRVQVSPERLSGYNVSLDELAHTIRTANSEKKAGSTESSGKYFTVYTGSFLRTVDDVSNLMITSRNGAPVYVRDVATVSEGLEEPSSMVSYYTGKEYPGDVTADGVPAVTIAIAKKKGSNGVTVAQNILDKIELLKSDKIGLITPDVHVEVTRNYGKTARDKVNSLITKLFIATGAVTLLVWFFLGWRPALVVTLVIPVVLLMTIFAAWLGGFTIDRVSLFALIFSIGILVDDAIVVIENIYRRWLIKGETDTATAIDAVREVGNPTILATFTVVAALMPMAFVSGLMGPYMSPIPALGSVAMIISLFAAFVFVPWLAMRIKPGMAALKKAEESEERTNQFIAAIMDRTLVPLIESRRKGNIFLLGLIGTFVIACSFFLLTWVPVKMMPFDNKPEFGVVINMPSGTALPTAANLTGTIAEHLRDEVPHITAVQTYVGIARPFDFNGMVRHYYLRDRPWQAAIQIQLKDKSERSESSHELAVMARGIVDKIVTDYNQKHYPDDRGVRTTIVEMPPGPPVLQTVVAEIYGPDAPTRREVARQMTHLFQNTEGMADVDNYLQDNFEVWRFEVDVEKAVRRGISVDTINRNLTMALGASRLGDIKRGSVLEPTYIVLEISLAERSEVSRLGDLPIPMPEGKGTIPLIELGRFVKAEEDHIIFHKDLRPVEYVVGDAVGRLGAPIYPMLKIHAALQLEENMTPDGVNMSGNLFGVPVDTGQSAFKWGGEWTITYETYRDMGIAFAIALLVIYVLVVWEFGNFVVPAIIMAPIPLTMLGIIPGHALLGAEFTATSMIGFIALAGIIVRNSILLVDFAIQQVRQGYSNAEAVLRACSARTRPILITALALVAGSFVILTDPIFQGMAISLLFGVMVSSVLTLVVIPLGCISAGRHLCPDCDLLPPTPGGQGPGGQSSGGSWTDGALARANEFSVTSLRVLRSLALLSFEYSKVFLQRAGMRIKQGKKQFESYVTEVQARAKFNEARGKAPVADQASATSPAVTHTTRKDRGKTPGGADRKPRAKSKVVAREKHTQLSATRKRKQPAVRAKVESSKTTTKKKAQSVAVKQPVQAKPVAQPTTARPAGKKAKKKDKANGSGRDSVGVKPGKATKARAAPAARVKGTRRGIRLNPNL